MRDYNTISKHQKYNKINMQAKSSKSVTANVARIDQAKANQYQLPGDMLTDLQDAFAFYDKENIGYINMTHFRNILHNFGFHRLSKREIDDDLKRADPEMLKRSGVDFETTKYVIAYRWAKGGANAEAAECFRLFDKKDR